MITKDSAIFITGATGFLGSYIIRKLISEGYTNVHCLKRKTSSMSLVSDVSDHVKWVEGDILDVVCLDEALQNIDYVIHAAAVVSMDPSKNKQMRAINIEGTANVVNMSLKHSVKKLVHISSIAALGRAEQNEKLDEKTKWTKSKYNSCYSITKHQAELEVWRGEAEGLSTIILNPSFILGAGEWVKTSGQIFSKIYDGLQWYPSGSNGYVDVRDVAAMTVMAMETDKRAERYICTSENMSYKDVLFAIADALNKKRPSKVAPKMLFPFIWRMEWLLSKITGKPPIVTRDALLTTSVRSHYDNSKSLIDFDFNYRPMVDTIKETATLFLQSKKDNKDFAIFL